MSATNTPGQVLTAAVGCLVWVGGMGACLGWSVLLSLPSKPAPPRPVPPAQVRQVESPTPESELHDFAQQQLPELGGLLNRADTVLAMRRGKLEELAETLRRVGDEPSRDADYRRWSEVAATLEARRGELIALRKAGYVAFRKHAIANGNPQIDPLAATKASFDAARPAVEEAIRRAEFP